MTRSKVSAVRPPPDGIAVLSSDSTADWARSVIVRVAVNQAFLAHIRTAGHASGIPGGDLRLAQHNVDDNLLHSGDTDRHGKGHVFVGLQPDRLRKAAASRVTT
jgi:hypothetical protein